MEKIWLKNYPQGVDAEVSIEQYKSITDMYYESIEKYRDFDAYENMGASISFGELDQLSRDFAAFLQNDAGLKKGDRIAVQMPNVLQYPVVIFAALRAGLTIVNTNPLYTAREMKHQFKDSDAKAIVILENFADKLEEVLPETNIKTVVVTGLGDLLGFPKSLIVNSVVKYLKKMVPNYNLPQKISFYEALDKGAKGNFTPITSNYSDIAFLQYTGGTTGVSKGAMLTHKNMIANMLQISQWMSPQLNAGEERIITALPLYHIFSLTVNCMAFMRIGCCNILITNPKDIPGFIKLLRKSKYTVFTGVNTLFNALMNHKDFNLINFKKLKISVAGGMALQKSVTERWLNLTGTPVIEGYGLTEASPVVSCNPLGGGDRVGTIGMPLPSTNVKILNEEGKEMPVGEAGELCVKGPQVMAGYWNRPDETEKVLNAEGWLKTGDIAQMEGDGYLKIVDRIKDMILVSGFNVYPNEIEEIVASHPQVSEVAAVGIGDEKSGEVVKVFVVKRGPVTEKEIIDHCRKNLVAYKVPKFVEFRNELPKTNVGKILRRALREA